MNWNTLAVSKQQKGLMIREKCEMLSVNILAEFLYGEN